MIHDTQIAQISQKQDRLNIYAIMKSPQWLCGNSCTWAHDEQYCKRASCAQVMHDLPQSHCGNLEGTYILFMHFIFHIYNALENPLEKVTCEVLEKIEKIFNKFRDPVKVKLCRLQL